MRTLLPRVIAVVTLAGWVLSACLGQLVWLHVETEHKGHHETGQQGLAWLELHGDDHHAHEHHLVSARTPGLPSPRCQPLAPLPLQPPLEWSEPVVLRVHVPTPIPRPRGSPERPTVLLI